MINKIDTFRFTSAPYFNNSLTKFIFCIITAICNGVHPLTFLALTYAYLSRYLELLLYKRFNASTAFP